MIEAVFFGGLLILPALVVFAVARAAFIPKEFNLSSTVVLPAAHTTVWKIVSDFAKYPQWVSYVTECVCEDPHENIWLQKGTILPIRFKVSKADAPHKLEMMVYQPSVPTVGGRTFSLEPVSENQTRFTMKLYGEIRDPILRTYLYYFHSRRDPVRIFIECLQNLLHKQTV